MATLSWVEEDGALGRTQNILVDTPDFENSVQDWQSQAKLADNFETWHAQKKANTLCGQEVWTDAKVGQTDSPKFSDLDTLDQAQDLSDDVNDSNSSLEESCQYDIYYDLEKKYREPKVKAGKWKLSTPPALSNIRGKHQEKLASRTTARTTFRSNFDLLWVPSTAMWVGQLITDDDGQSLTHAPNTPLQAEKFESSFSEKTWAEMQLMELDPSFKKHRAYRPSLLRWCCAATEE